MGSFVNFPNLFALEYALDFWKTVIQFAGIISWLADRAVEFVVGAS